MQWLLISALPAGNYNGSYNNFGNNANLWSATKNYGSSAYRRYLSYLYAKVYRSGANEDYGYSVRCLRD